MQFIVIVLPSIAARKADGETTSDPEFGLTIAAIPITIVILLLAAFFTRRENKLGMVGIIILYFAALGYFLYKLVRIYQPSQAGFYSVTRSSLTTFGVITVILIVVTIVNAIVCTINFNKGLKPHVASRRKMVDHDEEKVTMTEMPNTKYATGPPATNRMTID